MKRIIYFLALAAIFGTSCDDDFLNLEPTDQLASTAVFTDQNLASAFLNNIVGRLPAGQYNSPGGGYGNSYLLASISDEARSKSGWVPSNSVVRQGNIQPNNMGGLDIWREAYEGIRLANEFLVGLDGADFSADFISDGRARARYVRAWFYFDLVRRYGAVPLVTTPQSLEDDLFVARTPVDEVYNFIFSELTAVAADLPNKSEAKVGGLSKQAATGLNARAMLFNERYSDAVALSSSLISGSLNDGLELFMPNPASPEEAATNYQNLFLSEGGNVEALYEITFLPPERAHRRPGRKFASPKFS